MWTRWHEITFLFYNRRFCTLYRAIQGDSPSPQAPIAERREEIGPIPR